MSKKLKAIVSEKTIVLHYSGKKINIQKQTDEILFKELSALIKAKDEKALIAKFNTIESIVGAIDADIIEVADDGLAYLKGSQVPMPKAIVKKLIELDKDKEDFLPLIRFWKKLMDNPSKNSREQLYGFILANNIPLTEQGDIVVEKGVNQKKGGLPGELVDTHSGTVDNSVGMVVEMPRGQVVDNPRQTCSRGLHVAAPDYVRKVWKTPIILECIVNPKDVVSVPVDYNNTKMRVCRYQVMGYSGKSERTQQVVKLSDFMKTPTPEISAALKEGVDGVGGREAQTPNSDQAVVTSVPQPKKISKASDYSKEIEGLSAKKIIAYVKEKTGTEITLNVKNKQGIIKKALELLEIHGSSKKIIEARKDEVVGFKTSKTLEKGPWAVELTSKGSNMLAVVKVVNELFDGGLKKSKETVDKAPIVLLVGGSKRFAQRYADKLSEVGADIKVFKPNTDKGEKVVTVSKMKKDELRTLLKSKFNEVPRSRATVGELKDIAKKLLKAAGYKVN